MIELIFTGTEDNINNLMLMTQAYGITVNRKTGKATLFLDKDATETLSFKSGDKIIWQDSEFRVERVEL